MGNDRSGYSGYGRGTARFKTAQICACGHLINLDVEDLPALNQKFCSECGGATITGCPQCNAAIRGAYDDPDGGLSIDEFHASSFCHECGHAYPWTASRIKAAHDLAAEIETLDDRDRETLDLSLKDLVRDTPQTQVAAVRFKKLMVKVGSGMAETFKSILVDVMSEAAKKAIFPSP